MKRFEYLVVYQENNRILTTNGNWQGEVERGEDGDAESCPDKFEYLMEAGAQGWELVTDGGGARFCFKRPKL